jgi:hypothetical protein
LNVTSVEHIDELNVHGRVLSTLRGSIAPLISSHSEPCLIRKLLEHTVEKSGRIDPTERCTVKTKVIISKSEHDRLVQWHS